MRKLSLVIAMTTVTLFGQNSAKTCETLSKINDLLQQEHVNPKPVDDSLSVYVFDNLIDELDPARNVFFKSEFDKLSKKYRLDIDDYIKKNDCSFLTEIVTVYRKDLLRNKAILEKINKENIDFVTNDTIRVYKKIYPIYITEDNIERVWKKKIRFIILTDVSSMSKKLDSIKANFNSLALVSKNTVIENELCKINALLEAGDELKESLYNHFCNYFDPHTNYFSYDTKSSFVASLSKEHLSLGLTVSLNEKNELIIDDLDPRGPAFRIKKIKKGDKIISISNQQETLNVSCSSIESISNLIQSESNKRITLTLKRKAGKNFTATIDKQIIEDEGNTVYSFVIDAKAKTGYIKIPSFYSDFEGNNSKGCAQDVAIEILKLKKDNITGLVIDLTDNGGGSMEEAVKLAGMFINTGPISIVVDITKKQEIIEDPYKGVIYKGPIVLIINGNSASASEFFASILQDYNRALLIGSNTLGKATMQTILPVEKHDSQDFVKVTINKFYRITGKSHQGTGVVPDVQIPVIYENIVQKESSYATAFKNDTIVTQVNFEPYMKDSLIKKLSVNSMKRIAGDNYFNNVKEINNKIDILLNQHKSAIPLTVDAIFEEENRMTRLWEEINDFDQKSINLKVSNCEYNNLLLRIYPLEKENNQNQIEALKTNHYLNEAISIIEDFNDLK